MAKAARTPVHQEVLNANARYAKSFGDKGKLALPPGRRFAILTCMDARLDPAKFAGLAEATPTSFATPADGPATTPSSR
jgi:carbonic anhydrase